MLADQELMISSLAPFGLLAETVQLGDMSLLASQLLAAIIFSVVGVLVFFGSLWVMDKLTPFSLYREIGEEHNSALAIIVGSIILGISIIIAAAILG